MFLSGEVQERSEFWIIEEWLFVLFAENIFVTYSFFNIPSLFTFNLLGFMTKKKNIEYPDPILSNVDYSHLGTNSYSLTDIEYQARQNCEDFLEKLEQELLRANMVQSSEMIIAHLCCYLGTTTTVFTYDKAEELEKEITNVLQQHAELSLSTFNHYLSDVNANNQSGQLEQLKHNAPGSIVSQTLRLGRIIMDMMKNLADNRDNLAEKQEDFLCPQDAFVEFLIPLIDDQHEEWQEDLDSVSINHAINQLTIQIAWLIGYFSYLDQYKNTKTYLEYGLPCISIYRKCMDKLLKLMLDEGQILTSMQHLVNNEAPVDDTTSLLHDIQELSQKTHAEISPATTKLEKEMIIVKAALEKLVIELILEKMEIKVINMALFHFWFTLDASLRGAESEFLDESASFEEMGNIIRIIKKTILKLPDPEFSDNIKTLNDKMQSLKLHLPNPEELDNVSNYQAQHQCPKVTTAIHTLIADYLKQDYHPEIVANVLFVQWLRLSVFYGISEQEWQKMDYYTVEILAAVKNYISTLIKK